jgi:hypothetical protein
MGAPALSDVVKAKRPVGGEYFGLYLVEKKVGYMFEDLELDPHHEDRAIATTELVFKATVGDKVAERHHREVRTYDSAPAGGLLSFVIEDSGDGGDQRLVGTVTGKGLSVVRHRPGFPDETLKLPLPKETVEDADQPRVALLRGAKVTGRALDGTDLQEYGQFTEVGPIEERLFNGVKVRLRKVTSVSEKDKVPMEGWLTDDGKLVEMGYGQSMRGQAEPKETARRLDVVEIFGLTRVTLPSALPQDVRALPAVRLVVRGLPAKFAQDSYRQKFKALPDDRTEVTLLSKAPAAGALKQRPLDAPDGKTEYLKSTLAVESNAPAIKKKAQEVVGAEKDAYAAAKKVVRWVSANVKNSYGDSADRATDVLRQLKGDCTEHSLLSVALLRAVGIPARRVDGLIYVVNSDNVPALYWHEWVEAYVGEWTQLDPTFNQTVADATHFALGEETGAEITLLLGQLKVLQVQ